MSRVDRVPGGEPGQNFPFVLPQEEQKLPRRGEANGRDPSGSAPRAPEKARPSNIEWDAVNFARKNPHTRSGILDQTGERESVHLEFAEDENGERIIKKVGVRRG